MRHTLPVQLAHDLSRVHPMTCRACTRQDTLAAAVVWAGPRQWVGGYRCPLQTHATCDVRTWAHGRMIVDTPLYARMLHTRSAMPLWLR